MRVARLQALIAALALAITGVAFAKDDFLRPQDAYKYTTRVDGDQVVVTWKIEKGYYLYRKKMAMASKTPGIALDEPTWPKGENHHDDYFGDQEIYRGTVDVPAALVSSGTRPGTLALELKLQGCADAGLCFPPMTWTSDVALPATSGGLKSFFKSKSNDDEFLHPDEAFRFSATMQRPDAATLTWVIADKYYLYRDRIKVKTDTANVQLGAIAFPKGEMKHDDNFGDVEVYHSSLEASVPVARAAGSTGTLQLSVTYQGCAEAGLCYNPITKTVALTLPPTDTATTVAGQTARSGNSPDLVATGGRVTEQDKLAAALQGDNLPYALLLFFVAGLVLSLTPCVLPMIPILSGIIVGQGDNVSRGRSFSLAFTYVQGMALTYAAAGAIFVVAFRQAPQAFFQQWWIVTLMVLLFVALAFAMFGAYTLQLPSALQTRLTDVSNQQKAGTFVGTFIMGALSALVVTACVAPAIVAALSVISQSRQIFRGALALYATGMGMGVPLLFVGASAGDLLPRVGPWMDTVKQLFGVVFLGVAIYLLQPLVPDAVSMLLWSALAVISGFWIFSLKRRDGSPALAPVRAVGLMAVVYGILLLIGAASGSHDPLQPLAKLSMARSGATAAAATEHGLPFQRIKTVAQLDSAIAVAKAAGKPALLDFYADWCTSCKEMEKYTFTDEAVRSALGNAVLLQADVTANDADDQALLQRFGIFGPPTIAFFGSDGVERRDYRLVGFSPAAEFRRHALEAFGAT